MDREFLDKLLEQISVSGCEECGQEVVKSHMQPFQMRYGQMKWEM